MPLTFDQLPQAVEHLLQKMEKLEGLIIAQSNESNSDIIKPLILEEAAIFLNLSVSKMYVLANKVEGLGEKRGKRWYFFKNNLIDYINTGSTKAKAESQAKTDSYIRKRKGRR